MKKQLLFLLLISSFTVLNKVSAQGSENSLRIFQIIAPSSNQIYKTIDSSDFIVRVENLGPNEIIPGDRFHIEYSISDGTGVNSQDFDTSILVGGTFNLEVGGVKTYTLAKDIKFNGNGDFSARANVTGTDIYTTNTNKNSSKSTVFVVNINEQQLEIEKAYYADGKIILNLTKANVLRAEVYDITGKLVKTETLNNKRKHTFSFDSKRKGFYFLKIISTDGRSATAKFTVH